MDPIGWYYQRRALNAMVQNKWDEAETFLQKQIAHKGPSMGLRYNLALAYLGQQQREKAYKQLIWCIDNYGESLRLCRLLGDIQYIHGERLEAIQWYELALEDSPGEKEESLIRLRLSVLQDEPRYQRALANQQEIERARSLDVREVSVALELFHRVIEDDPSHVEALNNLGSLYLDELGDADRAIYYFEEALALADTPAIARNLAKARKAKVKHKD